MLKRLPAVSAVEVAAQNEGGLITFGYITESPIPSVAGVFAPGAFIVNISEKQAYYNKGTTASPDWSMTSDVRVVADYLAAQPEPKHAKGEKPSTSAERHAEAQKNFEEAEKLANASPEERAAHAKKVAAAEAKEREAAEKHAEVVREREAKEAAAAEKAAAEKETPPVRRPSSTR